MLKIIKSVCIVALSLLGITGIIFLALGFIYPKPEHQTRVEINRSREVSWNYFTDESKMVEWMKGFKKIETISGKRNEIGSKYRMTFQEDGREIVMTETVKEFKPQERFDFLLENEVISDDVTITFSEENGKTIITQTDRITGGNMFWRSLFAVIQSNLKANAQEMLEKLKTNIEQIKH